VIAGALLAVAVATAVNASPSVAAGVNASPSVSAVESASYRFTDPAAWRVVRAHESPGYRLVLSSRDGRTLDARVIVDARPLPDDAPFPPARGTLPREALALFDLPGDPESDALAALVTRGSRTTLEAVERVIAYTSRRIRYELPGPSPETAVLCRRSGRGSCVGRSLLAADLLLRAGVPARQVTGILTASSPDELGPESGAVFSDELGGIRHRWIEAYVPGLGWVPSDPGGLANTVTARHVALAGPPAPGFAVETLSRTAELRRKALPAIGPGVTLARPRGVGATLVVRNGDARDGGAVALALTNGSETPRLIRTETDAARFENVPPGDYRVVWTRRDGRVEAASLRVDGPATLDLAVLGESLR